MTTNKESPDKGAGDPVVAKYLAGPDDDLVDVCMQVYSRACRYGTEEQHNAAMAYMHEIKRRLHTRAQDSGQGEAVAWMYPRRHGSGVTLCESEAQQIQKRIDAGEYEEGDKVVPLYTHPPKPAQVGEKDAVSIPIATLKWWRELVDLNPQDLAPRMDSYINGAVVPAREGETK